MRVITFTYNDLGISWGPAVHFLELWNEAAQADRDLEIVGYAPSWTGKAPIIAPLFDLRIHTVPNIGGFRQILWDLRIAARILREPSDLIYLRTSSFHLFSYVALRWTKRVVAVEVNGTLKHDHSSAGSGWLRGKLAELSELLILKRADIVFSVTEKLVEYCRSVNPDAAHVHVDNGVKRGLFEVTPYDGPGLRFIYVGTFTSWDGAARIVEIARRRPHLRFRMVGDGPPRAQLEQGAPPNVEFAGWVDYSRLEEEYAKCNAGIVLYDGTGRNVKTGGSSLKTREYLAAGLPVFTTRLPGQEFVEEGGYGILTSDDLDRDLDEFIARHEEFRQRLAASSAEIFEAISWSSAAVKTVDSMRSALEEAGGAPSRWS